jgi:hypothetical protein
VNGEGKGGWIWPIYFIQLHEDRTMKPVEIVLSRRRGMRENDNGGETYQGSL